MSVVYLDIGIGCEATFAKDLEKYALFETFVSQMGAKYGFPACRGELEEDQVKVLEEMFVNDPTWNCQGEILAEKPKSLCVGRLIFRLYDAQSPKAVENFVALCDGDVGRVSKTASKVNLSYKGNRFHRIEPGFVLQGGDIVKGDGTGGESIFGGKFKDDKEGLKLRHSRRGILSMANSGSKNSNTSQFFITLKQLPKLDGKHVVFGELIEDILSQDYQQKREGEKQEEMNVLKLIEKRYQENVFIYGCGRLN